MREAGYQLDKVQHGLPPDDAKAMPSIGIGVVELRIWDEAGTFRVVYLTLPLFSALHRLPIMRTSCLAAGAAIQRFSNIIGLTYPSVECNLL